MIQFYRGDIMKFGDVLKELRKQKKLTQVELANILNKSRSTIAGYEINDRLPEQETLIKISNYFNISLEELVRIAEGDSGFLGSLGDYIRDYMDEHMDVRIKISSIEELASLSNIDLERLNLVLKGEAIPLLEELKRIAVFGPFKYMDLLYNSIYYNSVGDPFKHLEPKNNIDLMRLSLILEINGRPDKFYDEIIEFYKKNPEIEYFDLIELYVAQLLHYDSFKENRDVLMGLGFDLLKIDEKHGAIIDLENSGNQITRYEYIEYKLAENLISEINDLPNEAIEELENYICYLRYKYKHK